MSDDNITTKAAETIAVGSEDGAHSRDAVVNRPEIQTEEECPKKIREPDPTEWIEPLLARENSSIGPSFVQSNRETSDGGQSIQIPRKTSSRATSEQKNRENCSTQLSVQHDVDGRRHATSSSSSVTSVSTRPSLQIGSNPFRARILQLQQQQQQQQQQPRQDDKGAVTEDVLLYEVGRLSTWEGFEKKPDHPQQLPDQTEVGTRTESSDGSTQVSNHQASEEHIFPHVSFEEPSNSTSKPSLLSTMHSTTQSSPSVGLNPGSPTSQSTSTAPRRSSKSHEEQRKETYAIRHITWKRRSDSPVQNISILVQNENGPCPLLALINAIVLRAEPPTKSPVAKALEYRERISLGLLIQALLEELLNTTDGDLPDIEDLSTFLTMLHTGMYVNPCLVPNSDTTPESGFFQRTSDVTLYSTFGVNLIHGWLAQPTSDTAQSLRRQKAIYYEDAEVLEIESNTFTDRVMKGEELTAQEELCMLDIERIIQFTKIDNVTQISEYGLACLQQALQPGSISVLFRNNHFATLYKHPETLTLFTLVTDAGFASRPEVVWESLDDLRGNRTRFLSGDFLPVGGGDNPRDGSASTDIGLMSAAANPQALTVATGQDTNVGTTSQEDADYAYALQIRYQEEEEEARRRSSTSRTSRTSTSRTSRTSREQVQRRASTAARPPPPTYEESRYDRRLVSEVARARRRESQIGRPAGSGGGNGGHAAVGASSAQPTTPRANAASHSAFSPAATSTTSTELPRKKDTCVMM